MNKYRKTKNKIKNQQNLIRELTFEYCKLLNNTNLEREYFEKMADETYKKFGKEIKSKKDWQEYYDFAINDLKEKISNIENENPQGD